ncbi:hypothetical protein V1525DRAFT_405893 [Lipomyces kononenkoae]|uniref:Uncharacterized protein n=1 Tax=Lipomyces kononenkoae TaxID=34357 RepID=A0ACC3SZB0_LIPKO
MQFKFVLAALALVASAAALNSTNSSVPTNSSVTTSHAPTATESSGASAQNVLGAGIVGAVVAGGIALQAFFGDDGLITGYNFFCHKGSGIPVWFASVLAIILL